VPSRRAAEAPARGDPVLEVRRLSRGDRLQNIHFTLHAGEILGIAGMLGSGRTELLMSLFGAEPVDCGEVRVGGKAVRPHSPAAMKCLGLALTPEDRKRQALVPPMSVRDNMCLAALGRIARGGLITKRRQRPVVQRLIHQLQIVLSSSEDPVTSLSGGNQQKVVIGNWLANQPRIILFDEPTRGIDVQAKGQMFDIIRRLSRQGISSIFVSSELEELLEVCHRILMMRKGRIVGELPTSRARLDELFRVCMEP
jgi:ribose transport system ATP-binding protein